MAAAAYVEPQPEDVGLELSDSDKECSICHELFTHPKLLPCAHVMCRHCILTWLSTNQEPVCPLCRCAIADTEQGKQPAGGWEKVVEELPDDVAMAALVECTRLLRGEHVCGGCRQSSAVSVCLHCGDMLCNTCTTSHANLSATKHHKVENLSTMTAEKLCVSQSATCSEHADSASELYCPKHGAAICHLCAIFVHRACPVILLDKRLQDLKEEMVAMSEMLRKAEKNFERAIDDLDNQLLEAEQKTYKALAEIEEACNRLENAVKACRKRLKELTLTFKQNFEVSVHDAQTGLKQRRGQVTSHRRSVDRVRMTSPQGELEKVTDLMRSRVSDIEVDVAKSSTFLSMSVVSLDSAAVTRIVTEILSFWDYTSETLSESPMQNELIPETDAQKLPLPTKAEVVSKVDFKALEAPEPLPRWQFASNDKALFSNNGLTVERKSGTSVILVSGTPMEIGVLYEVRIDVILGNTNDYLSCGVVKKPLSELKLPKTTLNGWEHGIVLCDTVYIYNEKKNNIKIGTRLLDLKEGDTVGFLRNQRGHILLFIGGKKQSFHVQDKESTIYIFCELHHSYRKITCLPPTEHEYLSL